MKILLAIIVMLSATLCPSVSSANESYTTDSHFFNGSYTANLLPTRLPSVVI